MNYELTKNSTFPLVEIHLTTGQEIKIERGSMVYHNNQVEIEGRMNANGKKGLGGMLNAMGRSMTSGESFFMTHAKGLTNEAEIAIAPGVIGSIKELEIGQTSWLLNTGVFLACDDSVSYKMKRQKLSNALFGGTGGLFVMETSGTGTMLISSYGDIVEIELDGSTPYVIDNVHVMAWENSLNYSIEIASGTFGFTTGEGLVNKFTGTGKILIQTRNIESLAGMLTPYLPSSGSK